MEKGNRIFVAGGQTLMGAALLRELEQQGYTHLVGESRNEPELTDADAVGKFFERARPEFVFMAGGKSGGIGANRKYPAELMLDNLLGECHVIQNGHRWGAKKLLYLASSCSYPRLCTQPMRVESLLTGPLEPTSEAYAVAKIAGIKLCEAFRQQYGASFVSVIPANPFGPGDDFRPEEAHVIAALIRRLHEAQERGQESVEIWGTGNPRREFIFADDLADACIFVMNKYEGTEPINVGGGMDLSIRELAVMIREVVGYGGELRFDSTKPDGMPCKVLESTRLHEMGWRARTPFRSALAATYGWFLKAEQEGARPA